MEPELFLILLFLASLSLYAFLGGADFGLGIWSFLLKEKKRGDRDFLFRVMGPLWEANHVWLIFCLVILLAAFPKGLAGLCQALWLPLLLALFGILLRGTAFALRQAYAGALKPEAGWEKAFGLGSLLAPFFLGAGAGALASGRLFFSPLGGYLGSFTRGGAVALGLLAGLFYAALSACLAAFFLCRQARAEGLASLLAPWRRRAYVSGAAASGALVLCLAGLKLAAPDFFDAILDKALFNVFGVLFFSAGAAWLLKQGHETAAALALGFAVTLLVFGAGLASYPWMVFERFAFGAVRGPEETLAFMMKWILAGLVLLVPCLILMFRVFRFSKRK